MAKIDPKWTFVEHSSKSLRIGLMRLVLLLLLVLPLYNCGFDKTYISSAPTIGEKTRGSVTIIRKPEVSIYLGPQNDLRTGEYNYIALPVIPIGGNSDEIFAQQQTKGKFVVQLAIYANQGDLSLKFSDISLNINQATYKVVDIERNPYAHYPDSQALRVGNKDVMCPESQKLSNASPDSSVDLTNDGLWECYDLVFPVDPPSPRIRFQIGLIVEDIKSEKDLTFQVPFEAYKWGHADSFP